MKFSRYLLSATALLSGVGLVAGSSGNTIGTTDFLKDSTKSTPAALHNAEKTARKNLLNLIKEKGRRLDENYNNYNYNANNNYNYNGDANYNNNNNNYYNNNANYNNNNNYNNNANYNNNNYDDGNYNNNNNNNDNNNNNNNQNDDDSVYNYNENNYYNNEYYNVNYDENQAERNYYRDDVDWANIGFNITGMSLKYVGCSAIQTYSDNYAANGKSPLMTKRFAVFRLCPVQSCSHKSDTGCTRLFGEYILELDLFVEALVEYNKQKQWHACNYCSYCNALESFGATMDSIEQKKRQYYKDLQQFQNDYNNNYGNNNNNNGNWNNNNYNNGNGRRLNDYYNNNYGNQNNGNNNGNNNGYNGYNNNAPYYDWEADLQSQWDDSWNQDWLNYDWRYLPYCSKNDLSYCSDAQSTCKSYQKSQNKGNAKVENFKECTQVKEGYYVAPHCGSDGYTISLGVYSDDTCDRYVESLSVYEIIGYDVETNFEYYPESCYSCQQSTMETLYNNYLAQGDRQDEEDQDNNNNGNENPFAEWMEEKFQDYLQEFYMEDYNFNLNFQEYNGNYQNNMYGNYNNGEMDEEQKEQIEMSLTYNQYKMFGYYYNRGKLQSEGDDGQSVGFYSQRYQIEAVMEGGGNEEDGTQYTEYGIADVCGELYAVSAKCNRNMQGNAGSGEYFYLSYTSEQQLEDEDLVCIFAENIRLKRYSERGSVVVDGTKDFSEIDWHDPTEVSKAYKSTGVSAVYLVGLIASILACVAMLAWAVVLHRTLVAKNIPWRPKRGRYGKSTDIETQFSGIMMGRSTTNSTLHTHRDDKKSSLL